jgi:hypothetical protein
MRPCNMHTHLIPCDVTQTPPQDEHPLPPPCARNIRLYRACSVLAIRGALWRHTALMPLIIREPLPSSACEDVSNARPAYL